MSIRHNNPIFRRTVTLLLATSVITILALSFSGIATAAPSVIDTIPVGTSPNWIGVNPVTNRIYVPNYWNHNVSVIDGSTNNVIGTVAVGTNPGGIGVNSATNMIYVANVNSNTVSVINGSNNLIVKTIDVGTNPFGIGVNPVTNRVFVVNNGSDNVSVINSSTNTVIETIPVGSDPIRVGVNTSTNMAYVTNIVDKDVSVIDGTTNTVIKDIAVGNGPRNVAVNPDSNKVYVSNMDDDTVSVINGTTNDVVDTIPVGQTPNGIAVNASTNKIYVVNNDDDNVSVIYGATGSLITNVTVGNEPFGVGVNPDTNRIYCSNDGNSTVSVIYDPNPVPSISSITPTTKVAGGTAFTLTVNGSNFLPVSKIRWNGADLATTYVSDAKLTATVPALNIQGAGSASVTVFNPAPGGGTSNSKAFTSLASTWYLAEGTSAWGFNTYISIENPNSTQCTASITYNTANGAVTAPDVVLPANSQTTVNPESIVPDRDFSTVVTCKEGKTIAVDRTMSWTGPGAASPEAHSSVGVTGPAQTWYLPEGSSNWGFETWLLIQNPNAGDANCTITYMTAEDGPIPVDVTVPGNSRASYSMEAHIGQKDASIKVDSPVPVIPERAMYRNNRREGHDSIGTTNPARDYYLAEGTTAWGFTTYVLVQNPNSSAADVTITYMTPEGAKQQAPFTMDPNSRHTVRVNDIPEVASTDLSTHINGSKPIIAERAMYWGEGTALGEACHDSIGMPSAHTTFYLPDGETSNGRETWTLVQNPNNTDVHVDIAYLNPTGEGNVIRQEVIPANSRKSFNMAENVTNGRASIVVTSKTAGMKIMVERAMYWNSRGVGADTIGGFAD